MLKLCCGGDLFTICFVVQRLTRFPYRYTHTVVLLCAAVVKHSV